MRRIIFVIGITLVLAGTSLFIPDVRSRVKALIRPAPPPQITPLALSLPAQAPARLRPTTISLPTPTIVSRRPAPTTPATGAAGNASTRTPEPTATPQPTPTSGPIEVNGRVFDAYIPAATKPGQFYQYSCEFDAAWVILATYGISATGDELIGKIDHDRSIEPYIEETDQGFIIRGGDIINAYSGDYTKSFLARSTATAMRKVFESYGLETALVGDRAGIEAALRSGKLVWMKTTVDFNTWRPAIWIMPDGRTRQTVLGNDHAVVAMGFSERGVVIRDVLGPTSTNRNRPYEYEVDWDTFMAAWGAQSFDGLAVTPPSGQ